MIKKVRLTTTLAKLREHHPCASGWATLLKSLPADYPQDKPINLLHILKSNGVRDMMWALRAANAAYSTYVAIYAAYAYATECPKGCTNQLILVDGVQCKAQARIIRKYLK